MGRAHRWLAATACALGGGCLEPAPVPNPPPEANTAVFFYHLGRPAMRARVFEAGQPLALATARAPAALAFYSHSLEALQLEAGQELRPERGPRRFPEPVVTFVSSGAGWAEARTPEAIETFGLPALSLEACVQRDGCVADQGAHCLIPCPENDPVPRPEAVALPCTVESPCVPVTDEPCCPPLDACPMTPFRDPLPADAHLVNATKGALDAALAEGHRVIALSTGTHQISAPIGGGRIIGACADGTRVVRADPGAVAQVPAGGALELEHLTVTADDDTAVIADPGSTLTLSAVRLEAQVGLRADTASVTARGLAVEAGRTALSGRRGTMGLRSVRLTAPEGATFEGTEVDAEELSIRWDGPPRGGDGLFQSGGALDLRSAHIEGHFASGLRGEGAEISADALYADSTTAGISLVRSKAVLRRLYAKGLDGISLHGGETTMERAVASGPFYGVVVGSAPEARVIETHIAIRSADIMGEVRLGLGSEDGNVSAIIEEVRVRPYPYNFEALRVDTFAVAVLDDVALMATGAVDDVVMAGLRIKGTVNATDLRVVGFPEGIDHLGGRSAHLDRVRIEGACGTGLVVGTGGASGPLQANNLSILGCQRSKGTGIRISSTASATLRVGEVERVRQAFEYPEGAAATVRAFVVRDAEVGIVSYGPLPGAAFRRVRFEDVDRAIERE